MPPNDQQFPPSSPILSHSSHPDDDAVLDMEDRFQQLPKKSSEEYDSFLSTPTRKGGRAKAHNKHVQIQYPTPNPSSDLPSSSIGELILENPQNDITTSPLKPQLVESVTKPGRSLSSDSKYKFISPMDNVKIVTLTPDQPITLGRSSKLSDQVLKKQTNISKIHCQVALSGDFLEMKCLGRNGMNLTIPKPSLVKFLGKKDEYLIEPVALATLKHLNSKGLSTVGRCNQDYDNLTNVMLLKDEMVKIPKLKGVLLDIWGDFVLLDYTEEEVCVDTEDKDTSDHLENENHVVIVDKVERSTPTDHVGIVYKSDGEVVTDDVITTVDHVETSNPQDTASSIVTATKNPLDPEKLESSNVSFKKPEKRQRSKTPVVEDSLGASTTPGSKKQKKANTEESKELYKDISDEEVKQRLEQIEDLQDIENVLVNHLAFSRLSSTPISALQKISNKILKLSKLDLQLILIKQIKCVGVIYRVGKDAAGKPLEEEYYYQVEMDDDKNRQNLVNDLKGASSSLRSCRKTHKQYFWKRPKSKSTK